MVQQRSDTVGGHMSIPERPDRPEDRAAAVDAPVGPGHRVRFVYLRLGWRFGSERESEVVESVHGSGSLFDRKANEIGVVLVVADRHDVSEVVVG